MQARHITFAERGSMAWFAAAERNVRNSTTHNPRITEQLSAGVSGLGECHVTFGTPPQDGGYLESTSHNLRQLERCVQPPLRSEQPLHLDPDRSPLSREGVLLPVGDQPIQVDLPAIGESQARPLRSVVAGICSCLLHTDSDCFSEEGCCPLCHRHCVCGNGCEGGSVHV
jgi:hypothetical protein